MTTEEKNMEDEFTVSWEDGSGWEISWFQDAGCYFAQRWFPEPDEEGADGPFVETPGPEVVTVEDLDTLEAVMGRPLPQAVRDDLDAAARCDPFTDERRRDWRVESAVGIARLHPVAGWIETFAPPGHPNPFADHWLPEATAWHLEKLVPGPRPDGRP
jgi:hypothetical protein